MLTTNHIFFTSAHMIGISIRTIDDGEGIGIVKNGWFENQSDEQHRNADCSSMPLMGFSSVLLWRGHHNIT